MRTVDPQSVAFREATPADLEPGTWEDLVHRGLVLPAPTGEPLRLPDDWEPDRWDAARTVAKTREQAAAAAAARGDDPTAYGALAQQLDQLAAAAAGGLWVPWLVDAARLTGYPVFVEPGWNGRGNGGLRLLEVVVGHHTATPDSVAGDYPSLRVVRDGRAGLRGLLSQLGIGRSGAIYVLGNGLAYHAGVSAYAGYYDLNDEALGIEAEDSGDGTWTAAQLDCYPRLVASLLFYMRRGAERYCSHRTCALPAGRKPDPAGIADAWMHTRVRHLLGDPTHRIPRGNSMTSAEQIADAVLNRTFVRHGPNIPHAGQPTNLGAIVAWLDAMVVNGPWAYPGAQQLLVDVAATRVLVTTLAGRDPQLPLDAEQLAALLNTNIDQEAAALGDRLTAQMVAAQAALAAQLTQYLDSIQDRFLQIVQADNQDQARAFFDQLRAMIPPPAHQLTA